MSFSDQVLPSLRDTVILLYIDTVTLPRDKYLRSLLIFGFSWIRPQYKASPLYQAPAPSLHHSHPSTSTSTSTSTSHVLIHIIKCLPLPSNVTNAQHQCYQIGAYDSFPCKDIFVSALIVGRLTTSRIPALAMCSYI